MTMHAAIYGRLGRDAQTIETRTGKPMASASLAVDVSPRDGEATVWVRVVGFGRVAESLALHKKGEMLSASGRLELSKWTGEDGAERENWQLLADSLVSARTVRPARPSPGQRPQPKPQADAADGLECA
jgi:single-stranded DNA-binding protein